MFGGLFLEWGWWLLRGRFNGIVRAVFDLRIDEASKAVVLPRNVGRAPVKLARGEILGVCLERRTTRTPSGNYFSYVPAIDRGGPAGGAIKLVRWGWTEAKARAFAQWLSEQLGVRI